MKEYYIYSPKWTKGLTRTFWREKAQGYTIDLNQAGLFSLEKYEKYYPRWNGNDIAYFRKLCSENDAILIHMSDVEKLGRKMSCILN